MNQVSRHLILLAMLVCCSTVAGQTSVIYKVQLGKYYEVQLSDRMRLLGLCTSKDSVSITMKTNTMESVQVLSSQIRRLEEIDSEFIRKGRYWFPNPFGCTYFIAPSAYLLKKGHGHYQATYGVVNHVEVGVLDHLTIGAGVEMISVLAPLAEGNELKPKYGFSAKTGIKISKKVALGLGGFHAAIYNYTDRRYSRNNLVYLNATVGNLDHHFTGIFGLYNSNKNPAPTRCFGLGGYTRVSRKTGLIMELWNSPGLSNYSGVALAGVRFFGRHLSCDVGITYVGPNDYIPVIPYFDLAVNF